jgi:hypothetical protein
VIGFDDSIYPEKCYLQGDLQRYLQGDLHGDPLEYPLKDPQKGVYFPPRLLYKWFC